MLILMSLERGKTLSLATYPLSPRRSSRYGAERGRPDYQMHSLVPLRER